MLWKSGVLKVGFGVCVLWKSGALKVGFCVTVVKAHRLEAGLNPSLVTDKWTLLADHFTGIGSLLKCVHGKRGLSVHSWGQLVPAVSPWGGGGGGPLKRD